AASLGALALSSSTASAFHPAGGGVHLGGGGAKFGGGLRASPHIVPGIRLNNRISVNNQIRINNQIGINNRLVRRWPHWRPHWTGPAAVAGGVAAAATYPSTPAATYPSRPATNTCTCLTKQYTPQGAVVFQDVCTNEMAMNPPANASPAAGAGPQ